MLIASHVDCERHGVQRAALACPHLLDGLRQGRDLGFHQAEQPDFARPDAWCAWCDARLDHIALELHAICVRCYDEVHRRDDAWPFVFDPEASLHRCAELLGAAPRSTDWRQRFSYLQPRRPLWALLDRLSHYFARFRDVFERGRLTWGCLVQANSALFSRGAAGAPGEVVYVSDPGAPVDLVELRAVADRLFELKGIPQADFAASRVSSYLANELERAFGLAAPQVVHDAPACALSTVFFERAHLPNRRLSQTSFPLLVLDELNAVAVVPSRYWGPELIAHWNADGPG